jgi:hypothetical protein
MAQEPNVQLEIEDLPRPTAKPAPARRWKPERPGEITSPQDMPWGGAFGTPGPDSGYALTILSRRDLDLLPGEDRHDAEAALAALMSARASRFGRAPVVTDAEVAEALLGFGADDPMWRRRWTANAGHDADLRRAVVAAVDPSVWEASPDEVKGRIAGGERLLA